MSRLSARWKGAEKQGSNMANEFLIPAERINRSNDYSISDYDIRFLEHPRFKLDNKYSQAGFKTSRMLDVVEAKYCKEKEDIPILLTKGYKEVGMKATVDARLLFMLLSYWLGYSDKQTLENIYYKVK